MQSKLQFISGPITYSHTGVNTPQGGGMAFNGTGASGYGTTQQYVMIENMAYPVMPSTTSQQPSPYFITYDPLEDIRAWYCVNNQFERQIDISISYIMGNVVWERHEFDSWFDDHCQDKVYVQRLYSDSWRLFFVSRDDWFNFNTWYNKARGIKWTITLDKFTDEERYNLPWHAKDRFLQQVEDWLKEHATGKYKITRVNDDVEVEFQNEQDAVMMKLVWLESSPYKETKE